jgi:hypothetical protein
MANLSPLHASCATSRQPWRLPRASLLLALAATLLVTRPANGQPVLRSHADRDGAAPFRVSSDAAGSMCPTAMTRFLLLAPPETTVTSGPPASTPNTSATFTFTSDLPDATFRCSVDGGLYAKCTSPFTLSGLSQGSHTLNVQAVSSEGVVDPSPAAYVWEVDFTDPAEPTIDAPPNGAVISNPSPEIRGTGEPNANVTLSLGGSTYGPIPVDELGAWRYTVPVQLAQGAYTITATVADAAGNTSLPVNSTFTVDMTRPDTTIVSGPSSPSASTTATFDFSSNEATVTYQCSLDNAAFAACGDPSTFTGLSLGMHTLQVRAVDAAGNVDATPATYTWTIGQDADDDGLPDDIEQAHGTLPNDADTDDDGLMDGTEDADHDGTVDANETDPRKPDTDTDGLTDGLELGLATPEKPAGTDMTKFQADADPTTKTDPLKADTDDGSVLDGIEDTNHNGRVDAGERDPLVKADDVPPAQDPDLDGVDTETETNQGLDPNDADSDDDGVIDGQDGLSDTDSDGRIDALDPDSDADGLNDGTERGVTQASAPAGTNTSSPNFVPDSDPSTTTDPKQADTDGDGRGDGQEDANKNGRIDFSASETNPNDPDTDDGGVSDGDEAQSGTNPLDDADDYIVTGPGCSTSGGAALPWAGVLLLLALPLFRARREQAARGLAVLLGLLGVTLAPAAHAQPTPSPASQAIDVQRYKPGPGATDILAVHGARVDKHLDWHLGASFNYARDPLGFVNPASGDFVYALVANQMTLDVMGSLSLFDRFELGVSLPLTSQSTGSGAFTALPQDVGGTGLGDVRLVPKAHLLSAGDLHLALVAPVLLPTAGGSGFRGGGGLAVQPKLVAEWAGAGGLRLVANVGATLRGEQQFRSLRAGNELAYGVAVLVPVGESLALQANVNGALTLTDRQELPLEVLAAVGYRLTEGLSLHVGGGPGLTQSYGTPRFRLFAGLGWSP